MRSCSILVSGFAITMWIMGATYALASDQSPLPARSPMPTSGPTLKWTDPIPDGIKSPVTDKLPNLLKHWPRKDIPTDPAQLEPMWMEGIRIGGKKEPYYVGIQKRMLLPVSPAEMLAQFTDFPGYKRIAPDLKTISFEKIGNLYKTFWERYAVVFFAPNTRYHQSYIFDSTDPNRIIGRYQLVDSNSLICSDGVLVMEKVPTGTLFTSFDFFNANWGPLPTFAPGKIWENSLEGFFMGDMAIRLRVMHPDWDMDRIDGEARKLLKAWGPVSKVKILETFEF